MENFSFIRYERETDDVFQSKNTHFLVNILPCNLTVFEEKTHAIPFMIYFSLSKCLFRTITGYVSLFFPPLFLIPPLSFLPLIAMSELLKSYTEGNCTLQEK